MAYSTSNPPNRIVGTLTKKSGGQVWIYISADAAATVAGANYFSNAQQLGMSANDIVFVVDTGTPLLTGWLVHSVAAAGAVLGASGITLGN